MGVKSLHHHPRLPSAALQPLPMAEPLAGGAPAPDTLFQPLSDDGQTPGLSAAVARLENASIPFSARPAAPAPGFILASADPVDSARALTCLTQAVYYEAANEPVEGQQAVAQVVLNRLRNPIYPKTVCGVIYQGSTQRTGCQFTFTCDGSLARPPEPRRWARSQEVAREALAGFVQPAVGAATNYHADYVAPAWNRSMVKLVQIGLHIFYGSGPLSSAYAGGEPQEPGSVSREAAASDIPAELPVAPVAVAEAAPGPPPVSAAPPPPAAVHHVAPLARNDVLEPAPPRRARLAMRTDFGGAGD